MTVLKNKDGALMLMVLIVLLLCTILGIGTIELASLEKKLSYYVFQSQQAQQAVDAGVEWAIEEIWRRGLPANLEEELVISDEVKAQIRVLEKDRDFACSPANFEGNEEKLPENEKKKCRYCLTSTALYYKAEKKVKVQVLYSYTDSSPEPYESVAIEYYCLE
ncbi:MAG: pilus assembly PilX N-terminal domain-containing protein [Syntrophomonas sp.]|uniref:pilus assembly PilX N-terminal domain-containing protein n=1 Tax=Syntrophomonas sp. TaxID=2053627 RepID=UPI0026389E85|nr:pilus assembly PilX N-terminal domain-containing protein [Syntrophomonas sp.]MDD2510227.1 pilus assembly PilX N-terminal domain-containing protein [Syntrophomonas sp.]MDD3879974.1 pilus assembly PilX N-terminal domain-containing protein [Syntrophomonas sp.]MDD4627166.1 pilus assembly PilX N-terminal domain-containing protein [Syntrophomonas sp.]